MYQVVRDLMLEEISSVPGIWDDCSELAVLGVRRKYLKRSVQAAFDLFLLLVLISSYIILRASRSTDLRAAMLSNLLCSRRPPRRASQWICTLPRSERRLILLAFLAVRHCQTKCLLQISARMLAKLDLVFSLRYYQFCEDELSSADISSFMSHQDEGAQHSCFSFSLPRGAFQATELIQPINLK